MSLLSNSNAQVSRQRCLLLPVCREVHEPRPLIGGLGLTSLRGVVLRAPLAQSYLDYPRHSKLSQASLTKMLDTRNGKRDGMGKTTESSTGANGLLLNTYEDMPTFRCGVAETR